ncbi:MAG: DUF1836 domain-containing protein [Clostridia bacterium]
MKNTKQERQCNFAQKLAGYTPIPWQQIPDLGLYMDQVITFVERQCEVLYMEGERIFTPAMVNNYVKIGLVQRPDGKKYGRWQLAQLLMICVLKQAASAEDLKRIVLPVKGDEQEALYTLFCSVQTQEFASLTAELPQLSPMTCAVRGATYRFLCNALLAKNPAAALEEEQP